MEIDFDLRGKDYLTEKEAAHYCCVSLTQFRSKLTDYSIAPITFMGKRVYRRNELQQAIEHGSSWRQSTNEERAGTSTGAKMANDKKRALVRAQRLKHG